MQLGINTNIRYMNSLPNAAYNACISKVESKIHAEHGAYVLLTYTVADGKFEGCKATQNFFVNHTDERTATIAKQKLASLVTACGFEGELTTTNDIPTGVVFVLVSDSDDQGRGIYKYARYAPVAADMPDADHTPAVA